MQRKATGKGVLYRTVLSVALFYIEKEVLYMAKLNNTEIMLKDIGMVYRTNDGRDVTALTGVTLDIEKGEFVSLVGPSGCGKTTLLRIIADLLTPSSGEIKISGESPHDARLKRRYGIVFQSAVLYECLDAKKKPKRKWTGLRKKLHLLSVMFLKEYSQRVSKNACGLQKRKNRYGDNKVYFEVCEKYRHFT